MASFRAGLLGLCLLLACSSATAQNITITDVLNFALNLEYLEANFYKCARDGTPLPAQLTGGGPNPTGCQKAKGMTIQTTYLLNQIAKDEIDHVRFLRAALGKDAVAQPKIDIGPAFAAAADAAAGTKLNPQFSPYTNAITFLHGAFIFEDVGVTAYHGAVPAVLSNADVASAAAGIMAVEAYHAGAVRTELSRFRTFQTGFGGTNVKELIGLIAQLRDAADCTTTQEDAGLVDLAPADSNGIAYARSTAGVLKIVYLGGKTKGGFFPNGVNGKIKTAC